MQSPICNHTSIVTHLDWLQSAQGPRHTTLWKCQAEIGEPASFFHQQCPLTHPCARTQIERRGYRHPTVTVGWGHRLLSATCLTQCRRCAGSPPYPCDFPCVLVLPAGTTRPATVQEALAGGNLFWGEMAFLAHNVALDSFCRILAPHPQGKSTAGHCSGQPREPTNQGRQSSHIKS